MYKWARYPVGLGILLFFIGVFFMFMDILKDITLIVMGVLCIGGGIVMDRLLAEEE